MQVMETLSEGLKREFKVVLPAPDLAARLEQQLEDLKAKVRINGFRPGKVPLAHLRRLYGKSVMADVVQEAVNEANRKIVEDNQIRLAMEPKIDFPEDKEEVEKALEAKGDLAFTVNLEILPKIEIGAFDDIEIERETAPVASESVDEALQRLAVSNRTYNPREADDPAVVGDKATLDFKGLIDGQPFEGGAGEDVEIVLGSGSFIPGFENQLEGVRAGEDRKISVRFPDDYPAARLAGKEAEFDVKVKTVASPEEKPIDDEFAKGFNFESLDKLRDALRENLEREYGRVIREKLKRALLDALDSRYSFELPPGLVDQEFEGVWRQVEAERKRSEKTTFDEEGGEEKARADYRRIAERRVRLGLLFADVGAAAKISVSDEELNGALVDYVRQFPGKERNIWDLYRKSPELIAQFRAPLLEEKVVDYILSKAKVTDRQVPKEEIFKMPDDDTPETSEKPETSGAPETR